eukprot:2601826-Rhodomonas_salina.2
MSELPHAFHASMEARVLGITPGNESNMHPMCGAESLAAVEFAFASGTHSRVGQHSCVKFLNACPSLVEQILRCHVNVSCVSEITSAIKERACARVSLHLFLSPGWYDIASTIYSTDSIVLSSAQSHSAEVFITGSRHHSPMFCSSDEGSLLVLKGLVLLHTAQYDQPITIEKRANWPRCVEARGGAQLVLENCLISSTFGVGVVASGFGSKVICRACEMDQCGISGAVALDRGSMHLLGCCIQRSKTSGVIALDAETEVQVTSSIVRDNATNAVSAYHGSLIIGSKSHFTGNDISGVTVHGQASRMLLTDCKLQENRHAGACVQSGGTASLKHCMLGHNGETGVDVAGKDSTMEMYACVVSDNHHCG